MLAKTVPCAVVLAISGEMVAFGGSFLRVDDRLGGGVDLVCKGSL